MRQGKDLPCTSYQLSRRMRSTITSLENDYVMDLQGVLSLPRPTRLDKSQAACLVAGLWQRLSVIHGPPGTGKSFIGSLIATRSSYGDPPQAPGPSGPRFATVKRALLYCIYYRIFSFISARRWR
ncbi:hypothetical protein DL98DRAFT_176665 [Cadophora sp. DSE1049]|nr:hypothetical protein DL98DRAFT_176665 [Cadophora sp. DSE1049]